MNTHTEKAAEYFLSGCGCAQAVLAAFTDVTGLDEKTSLRLASSFGGGMGRMREVCGACSAMFMVAGLIYGGYDPTDVSAKSAHYALIQRLADEFRRRNDLAELYRQRCSQYESFSDGAILNNGAPEDALRRLKECIE